MISQILDDVGDISGQSMPLYHGKATKTLLELSELPLDGGNFSSPFHIQVFVGIFLYT
jgi:hypothetical protein